MPVSPNRIAEDLRGLVSGDVLSDDASRLLYSTDASLYEILPSVVVRPRVTADVAATLRYASSEAIPVHARGAGSGLAGGALGEGIVIDFSRYMRRLLSDDGDTVRVQPGLVHADLNRRLAASGRVFGPDPITSNVTTLGGAAAVDASGSQRPFYGSVRDHVESLNLVTASGDLLRVGRHLLDNSHEANGLVGAVSGLLATRSDVIREQTARGCVNTSGYHLDGLIDADELNLAGLVVGSEGTLGLITELTLRVTERPAEIGSLLLTFPSLERAAQAVQELAKFNPAACDLMDRRHLGLAREVDPRYEVLLPGAAEAVLYVELFARDPAELQDKTEELVTAMRGDEPIAAEVMIAETEDDRRLFRDLSSRFLPMMHGLQGKRRAAPGVEGVALPPAALPQFFLRLQDILKRRQITASVYGHALHGQLHLRPLLDLTQPAELRKLETLASDLYDTVWLLGGAMSGQHGDGLSRTPFSSRQHGPLVNVFREVKRLFDPAGVLNPGKIVPLPGARMTGSTRRMRTERYVPEGQGEKAKPAPTVELQLSWDTEQAMASARDCNGCGACRTGDADSRMCPIFRFTPREEASPRAKANLLRSVLAGRLPPETLLRDDVKQIADLCVNCHQCRLDCPAEVDIPKMMLEAKASYVKTNGLRRDAWWSTRVDMVAGWLSRMPRLTNALLEDPRARWCLERTIGLAMGRRLPRFNSRPYLKAAAARKLDRPSEASDRVLYFVDTYANYFDGELAESFERIMRRHKVEFYVPSEQLHCGMAMISQGAVDDARRVASRNVSILAESVRRGYSVVATDPAAVLALTREYLHLLPEDDDAQLVAENTFEACHYLWKRHLDAQLQLDLDPLPYTIAHHTPCHLKALGVGAPSRNLLRLIPELRLEKLEKGCSGMAGTYGLSRRNYRSSLRAGLPLLSELRKGEYQFGATECGSCRTQMEQSSPMPTLHPVKLLAASYGVMPSIRERLARLATQSSQSS